MRLHMPAETSDLRWFDKEPVDGRLVIFAGGRVIVDSKKSFVSQAFGAGRTWVVPIGDVRIWRFQKARDVKRFRDTFGTRVPIDLLISNETIEAVAWAYEDGDGPTDLDDFLFFDEEKSRAAVLPIPSRSTALIR